MGSDHIQEKTELLFSLINERKLSDLPKIRQVVLVSLSNCKKLWKPSAIDALMAFLDQLCTQPTLIVWGEQDQVFPMELAHRLERSVWCFLLIANSRFQIDVSDTLSSAKL
jgi:pimeloyl-ACP methyl ester carboxylesterase